MNIFKISYSRNGNTIFASLRVGKSPDNMKQAGAFTFTPLEWEQFCYNMDAGWPKLELIMEDKTPPAPEEIDS